ncbi:MAG: hypothetical protein GY696_26545 [Gammaproteobacteria bacterium]|nr:hypothetical protein [Gammaproteobacteria bacterium]
MASRYVRRKLIGEAHTFVTYEQLRDRTISEGLANDTCMDGLNATNPYTQAQQGLSGARVAGTHAMQTALGYAHWTPPEPARVQNQSRKCLPRL